MLGDVGQSGDGVPVSAHGLQHRHQLVVHEGVGRPALAEVGRLTGLGVADRRRAHGTVGVDDGLCGALDQIVREVRVHARGELVDPRQSECVRRRLVVRCRDEDAIEVHPGALRGAADPVLVDVEQALLVDDLDRDGVRPVGDDYRARADRVRDAGEEARRVGAPAEQVALPTAVAVAVQVRVARLEVAGALEVLVGLLEGERPRAVVLRALRHGGRAVRGIVGHEAGARWGEVPDRRPDAEVRGMPAAARKRKRKARARTPWTAPARRPLRLRPSLSRRRSYSQNGSLLSS